MTVDRYQVLGNLGDYRSVTVQRPENYGTEAHVGKQDHKVAEAGLYEKPRKSVWRIEDESRDRRGNTVTEERQ